MAKSLLFQSISMWRETTEESGIILKRYGKRPRLLEELGYLDHPSVFASWGRIKRARN